jgi:glycosyltransferase involved in cell wall biosynthesis
MPLDESVGVVENQTSGGRRDVEASVIVPCYNSKDTIQRCLRSLGAQRTSVPHELIVVDSSDDGTTELIAGEFSEVVLVRLDRRTSCGAARNIGVRRARGRLVLFVDADCIVPADWIERMVLAYRDLEADALCGAFVNGTPWSVTGTTGFFLEFFRFLGPRGPNRMVTHLLGGNSIFRRSLLLGESFPDGNAGDDFNLSWRLSRSGARLFFTPSIGVTHLNRLGLKNVVRHQCLLGQQAAWYRAQSAPRLMAALRRLPFLVALMPPVVLVWIGARVVRQGPVRDACRYAALWPLLLAGNYAWAFGFLRALLHHHAAAAATWPSVFDGQSEEPFSPEARR